MSATLSRRPRRDSSSSSPPPSPPRPTAESLPLLNPPGDEVDPVCAATHRKLMFWMLLAVILLIGGSLIAISSGDTGRQSQFLLVTILSTIGYLLTIRLIPFISTACITKANLWGRDINKLSSDKVPESLGIVVGTVYLTVVMLLQPFWPQLIGDYNAAMTAVCFMLFLGFMDDVLDLRWAVKIFLSFLASLPLLVAYSGPTNVIVPKPLREFLGLSVELGYLYHLYMALVTVFCTNSINIYAGINGLEAVQSVIIAIAVVGHNALEMAGPETNAHTLSIFLMLPFIACTLGLIYYNWYPSKVFVGDSFTYLAGITLAVAGIEGHFSKTLMLFFLPQLINFAISIPQLIGLVPCPRHRVPKFNPATNKLEPTYNFTVINLYLYFVGPQHEASLTFQLGVLQIVCCLLGFVIRYHHAFTSIFYDAPYLNM